MALLGRHNRPTFWDYAFLCLIALLLCIAMLMGCRVPTPVLIKSDSTTTTVEVHHRDTVITIPGDVATHDISADLAAFKRMIDELRKRPLTVKGERNAQLTMSVHNDSLRVQATCDSLEVILQDAITTIDRRTERIQFLEQYITEQAQERPMPSWAKGIALAACSLALVGIVVLFILKRVFKLF